MCGLVGDPSNGQDPKEDWAPPRTTAERPDCGGVFSLQELSVSYRCLLPSGAESSKYRTKESCDLLQMPLSHRMMNY
jgi:hypothetical protein